MNGVTPDKKPERRVAPEKLATWMGGLSVVGILFCLLLEETDVSADLELMLLNAGFVCLFSVIAFNFIYGGWIYCKSLLNSSPRRYRSTIPLSFAVSMLAAALISWLALKRNYDVILAHTEGELRLAVAQQNEYRERLKGASPDQAASKISQLEDELAMERTGSIPGAEVWPALTPNQIDGMSEMLRRYPVGSVAVFFVDRNSENFRGSLNEVFRRALWPPAVANIAATANGMGITVRSRADEGPAFALVSQLRRIGYQVSFATEGEDTAGRIEIYIWSKPQ
jgi:hypothetical protein